jgi:hypothetical protein
MKLSRKVTVLAVVALCALIMAGAASARMRRKHSPLGPLPSMGAEPNPSLFGIDTAVYDSSRANFNHGIPAARGLGARWGHFTAGAATGAGRYGMLDREVRKARAEGMGVVVSVGGVRSACSLRPRPANVHACAPRTAADLRNYRTYFRRLVLRYRNVVNYYESWTEENNRSSWLPRPNARRYAAVLRTQYSVIQTVNRRYGLHLQLLFGSPSGFSITPQTNGWIAVLPYTRRVLRALHGRRAFDGVALHAYRFPPGRYAPSVPAYDYVRGVPRARGASGPFPRDGCNSTPWCRMTWPQELSAYEQEFARAHYGEPPLWLTEFGWPGDATPSGSYFPSEAAQASDLVAAYQDLMRLPFVKAALWFNLRDYQPGYPSPDPSFFFHYGLLEYDYSAKQAAAEFRALAAANPGR